MASVTDAEEEATLRAAATAAALLFSSFFAFFFSAFVICAEARTGGSEADVDLCAVVKEEDDDGAVTEEAEFTAGAVVISDPATKLPSPALPLFLLFFFLLGFRSWELSVLDFGGAGTGASLLFDFAPDDGDDATESPTLLLAEAKYINVVTPIAIAPATNGRFDETKSMIKNDYEFNTAEKCFTYSVQKCKEVIVSFCGSLFPVIAEKVMPVRLVRIEILIH